MFGIDRRAAKVAWTILLIALAVGVVYVIRRTLMIFVAALFFAYLLAPVVGWVERRTPKKLAREFALAIVYVLLVAALVTVTGLLGARIAEEAASLASRLPESIKSGDPLSNIPIPSWLEPYRVRITDELRQRLQELDKVVLPLLAAAGTHIVQGVGNALSLVLIPILSFFFLKDGPLIRNTIVDTLPYGQSQTLARDIFADLHHLLAQYIRALVILSIATLVFYFAYLVMTGVPYALMLAGLAAILEFIPVAGPLIASAVIVLVAGFSGYPHILWILVFLVLYRLFQDYVLQPYLMSSGVELHPLLVLFGVLAGEQIGGVAGMFLSVPVMAALRVVFVRARRRARVD
jgi:predicted PurR-regulated permease PerM